MSTEITTHPARRGENLRVFELGMEGEDRS
jgi:hypothetical protein